MNGGDDSFRIKDAAGLQNDAFHPSRLYQDAFDTVTGNDITTL
jgi:hypothetical protein